MFSSSAVEEKKSDKFSAETETLLAGCRLSGSVQLSLHTSAAGQGNCSDYASDVTLCCFHPDLFSLFFENVSKRTSVKRIHLQDVFYFYFSRPSGFSCYQTQCRLSWLFLAFSSSYLVPHPHGQMAPWSSTGRWLLPTTNAVAQDKG